MKELADDLYQLRGFPPNGINVYLMGDVLIDAATRYGHRRIFRELYGRDVAAHALTHAHADHEGSSNRVCETLAIPMWCGERDVAVAESGDFVANMARPPGFLFGLFVKLARGPGHPVARALKEGDEVAGFKVLETPGHTPGHVSFWRESDRALICGDVLFNMNIYTGVPGLREPIRIATPDPATNRDSARRLAELEPALVCFGHGPPLRDTRKFVDFVSTLA
jgi:hydroxyacylglutathione hydrolase